MPVKIPRRALVFAASALPAQRWLVAMKPHHRRRDFGLDDTRGLAPRPTWASASLFLGASMFDAIAPGTPMRLATLNQQMHR